MHVYAHLFDEATLGQIRLLRSPATLVQRLPGVAPAIREPLAASVLRTPPTRTRPCQGSMSVAEGHQHAIVAPIVGSGYGFALIPIYAPGQVAITWQDVRAGVAKTYVTTENDGHAHVLTLTAGELAGLRAGKTLTKQTSRDARPGGRQHAHTVTLSCFHEVNQYALTPPNYVSGY